MLVCSWTMVGSRRTQDAIIGRSVNHHKAMLCMLSSAERTQVEEVDEDDEEDEDEEEEDEEDVDAEARFAEQVLAAGAANGEALASGASPQQLPSRQEVRE